MVDKQLRKLAPDQARGAQYCGSHLFRSVHGDLSLSDSYSLLAALPASISSPAPRFNLILSLRLAPRPRLSSSGDTSSAALLITVARALTVGPSNSATTGRSILSSFFNREMTFNPIREFPPRSKKLSWIPNRSIPRASCQTFKITCSISLLAATYSVESCGLMCRSETWVMELSASDDWPEACPAQISSRAVKSPVDTITCPSTAGDNTYSSASRLSSRVIAYWSRLV